MCSPSLRTLPVLFVPQRSHSQSESGSGKRTATAVIYCEENFGKIDGKTANGLIRHSEKYEIFSVIDSKQAGLDAGKVLGGKVNAIPISAISLTPCLAPYGSLTTSSFGMAPKSGMLSTSERGVVLDALARGMNVVSGLHEFLTDDPEFVAPA